MLFSQIPGLEETKKSLINSVNKAHVAHAQLFLGNEGSANLALALAYATFINCENKNENDSCGQCSSCTQYSKLVSPDMHLIFPLASLDKVSKEDLKAHLIKQWRSFIIQNPYGNIQDWGTHIGAENKQFNIPVEEGRGMIQSISLKAYQSEYKVVLIWMPELMNISTANSILKALEEPPAKTLFFLIANDYEKLLSTILSRCQMIKVRAFHPDEIVKYLTEHNICDEKFANRISKIAEGNLNRAIQLSLETKHDTHALFMEWMRLCFSRKFQDILLYCEDLSKKGRENQKNLLLYSMQVVRDALMNRLEITELIMQGDEELKFIQNFSKALNESHIEKLYHELNEAYQHIERNGNAKIVLFDTSIKISSLFQRN